MCQPTSLNLFPDPPDTWANEWGRDRYGLHAGVIIAGATQTFRWIPAGTFLMGSPESEYARNPVENASWEDAKAFTHQALACFPPKGKA